MAQLRTLIEKGNWYKGNTHLHTTMSDGKLEPKDSVAVYRDHGYDWLAVTDHGVWGIHDDLQSDNFIVFPGTEFGTTLPEERGFCHHVVFMAKPGDTPFKHGEMVQDHCKDMDMQGMIDYMTARGCIAIYCHPRWSLVEMEEYKSIKGCTAMEIYNHTAETACGNGDGVSYFDHSLWQGDKMLAVACDDAHYRSGYMGGWIVVKAKALTHDDIMASIKAGSFYASNGGPEIKDFYIEDGVAHIECAPAARVALYGDGMLGAAWYASDREDKSPITHQTWNPADAWLPRKVNCLYAMVTGDDGNVSWTNPVWMD